MRPDHDRPYLDLPEAAALVGRSRQWAWQTVKEQGHLLGVTPVRVTARKVVIPRKPFERAIGLAAEPTAAELPVDWYER